MDCTKPEEHFKGKIDRDRAWSSEGHWQGREREKTLRLQLISTEELINKSSESELREEIKHWWE